MQPEIEVVIEESIVDRGVRRVQWFARVASEWEKVSGLPGATTEQLEPAAGTVWQIRVAFAIEAGSHLMRVESLPARDADRGVLGHLTRSRQSSGRRVHRTYFRVGRRGQLIKQPGDPTSPAAPS